MYLTEIGPHEIEEIIQHLGSNKAGDIYNSNTNLVKLGGSVLTQIMTLLFNKSFDQGVFPSALKVSKIVPIHKGDSLFELSNYRPISLLPIFSKILEKLMYIRVIGFIERYNILYENQYGFQKGLSTEFAIHSLVNNIIQCLENKEVGFCILLDFAKAFDTVNHEILLDKLDYYGIRGITHQWFKSYLADRKQCTEICNIQSEFGYVKHDVPQGSILGPLLFLLYINDIVLSSSICKFTLFADDTSLFYSNNNKAEGAKILNAKLSKIAEWLAANKLSLNVSKSKLLIFSKKRSIIADKGCLTENSPDDSIDSGTSDVDIFINGQKLNEVDHAKYLGALLDNKLNWSYQIDSVNMKLCKGNGLLAKIRHYVPSNILRSLYFSFMNPYIDYNLLNWDMALPTKTNVINLKIKKAVRIMSFKQSQRSTDTLYKDHEILHFDKSVELKYGKFMWKLHNGFLPNSLVKNFSTNSRTRFSRSISRLESLKSYILFEGPKMWDQLPLTITSKPSLSSFSKALKNYFIHGNPNHNMTNPLNPNTRHYNQSTSTTLAH